MEAFEDKMNEEKIVKMPELDFIPDSRGVGYVFFKSMSENKNNIAQIDGITGQSDTYATLLQRCIRTAINMRAHHVTSADIISICSTNHLDSCVPFISTFFLGGTIASLDPLLSLKDSAHLLTLVRPKLIFVSSDAIDLIENAVEDCGLTTKIVVFGNTAKHVPFSKFLQESEDEDNFRPYEIDSLKKDAVILFSSGTTGLPKGICISHNCYLGNIALFGEMAGWYDRVLNFSTLYWVSGALMCGLAIVKGTTRITLSNYDVKMAWEAIAAHKVSCVFTSPYQMLLMYNGGRPAHTNLDSLKAICIAGGVLSKDKVVAIRHMVPTARVNLLYGLTESFCVTYFRNRNDDNLTFYNNKPLSSGSGVKSMSYKIVDEETEEILGPNQKGELRIKTKYMLSGYYNMDSSNIWDADGWLKTGDIAYYDDDYYFYILGRTKEMFKFRSYHVVPTVIENVLLTHASVNLAVVVGVPHEIDGEHPMGIVELKESHGGVTEEELIKYVDERVHDREKLRGGLKIVDKLPLTPSGKVNKRLAKSMILNGTEHVNILNRYY